MTTLSQLKDHLESHDQVTIDIDGIDADVTSVDLSEDAHTLTISYTQFDRDYQVYIEPWGLDHARLSGKISIQDTDGDELLITCKKVPSHA